MPLLGPAPVAAGGDTLNPEVNACFTCTPPYQHARQWKPDPDTPGRPRTLVLCFDGTGDSFDQDVSGLFLLPGSLVSCSILNAAFTELQRRPVLGDVEEGRSYKAARLLSGDFPRSNSNSTGPRLRPFPSGWNRHIHEQCAQDADC